MAAALTASAALAAAGALALYGAFPEMLEIALPGVLFLLMISYQGVRLGRSTHIVDMADADRRAAYTALSNSVIGVLLLIGGVFGVVAELGGNGPVLWIFAAMCVAAFGLARGLEEVQ